MNTQKTNPDPVGEAIDRAIDTWWCESRTILTSEKADNLRESMYRIATIARAEGRKEGLEEAAEVCEEHGHQQEDDTIWCEMDKTLSAIRSRAATTK